MEVTKVFSQYKGFSKEIYTVAISKFVIAMGNFIIPFLSFYLITKQHVSESTAGIFVTIISLSYIPATILGGKVAAAKQQKKLLVFFYLFSAVSYFLVAFIDNVSIQLILIIIGKFSLTLTEPMCNVIINNSCEPAHKKTAFSLLYFAMNIGFAIGPMISGLLFENHTNLIFILDALSKVIVAFLMILFINDKININITTNSKKQNFKYIDLVGRYRNLVIFSIIMIYFNFCYSQQGFTLSLFLQQIFSSNGARYYGYLMTTNALCIIIFTSVVTSLTSKISSMRCIFLSGLFLALGFGLYCFTYNLPLAILYTAIWSIGEILLQTNFVVYISENCSQEHFAMASSFVNVVSRLGLYLNPLIMGCVVQYTSIKSIWIFMFISMVGFSVFTKFINNNNNDSISRVSEV